MKKLQAFVSHFARIGSQYKEKITPDSFSVAPYRRPGLHLFPSSPIFIPHSGHYADELGVTGDGQTVTIEETPQEKAPVITKRTVK